MQEGLLILEIHGVLMTFTLFQGETPNPTYSFSYLYSAALGKPRIKNDSESRREKAEHRKEKERKNPMKMGQGSKSWSLGVHSFILSHRESAETAYSLLLTVWENIDFERLGNCSRSRS